MMSLPEAQRAAVVLVCVDGYSYREAAEVMEIPIGTVMSRPAAARAKISKGHEQEKRNQMSDKRKFSDEQLTAYLDGEADEGLAAAVEAAAGSDPRVAKRLQDLALDTDAMRGAFDNIMDGGAGMPDDLAQMVANDLAPRRQPKRYPMAFAVGIGLFCLGLGGLIGSTVIKKGPTTWQDHVAVYHALHVKPTLSEMSPSLESAQTALDRAAKALGGGLALSHLSSVDGMTFKRAQVLGFEGRPLIQIAYLSRLGDPIALCIIKSADAKAGDVSLRRMQGMSSATWSRDGYEFLLIGGRDDALIRKAAAQFAETP